MKASEFANGTHVVQVTNPELKAGTHTDKYTYNWSAHKFPKEIIITEIISYDKYRIYVVYFNGSGSMYTYVPKDFEFTIVSNEELKKSYTEYLTKDLTRTLRHNLTLGSDPEMFVVDEHNKVIPAFDFLGSKTIPHKTFAGSYGNTNMYWDGFQAEFETQANTCLGWHTDSVQCGIKGLYQAAKRHNPKAKLSLITTLDISLELLETSAEEHVQFGCTPSINAYDMKGLTLNGRDTPFRSAGGHIHFGVGQDAKDLVVPIVKALDAVLAVACVSMFAAYDDPRRRSMYGLAGEYRLPPHGIEYRTLSNAWMCHPAIMNLVFDVSRKAFMFGKKGLLSEWQHKESETIETINTCNVDAARASLERNKELFMKIIAAAYPTMPNMEETYKAFFCGVESVIDNPNDVETNWLVAGAWEPHAVLPGKNWNSACALITKGTKVS